MAIRGGGLPIAISRRSNENETRACDRMWCCATSERCFVALAAASVNASNVTTYNLQSKRLVILERNMEPAGPLQLLFGKDGLRTHCPTRDAEPRQLLDRTQPSPHHLSDQQCNICIMAQSDTDKKLQQSCEKTAKKLRNNCEKLRKNCECNISTETRKLQKNCEKTAKNCKNTAKNCEKTARATFSQKTRVQHFKRQECDNVPRTKSCKKTAKKLRKNCEKNCEKNCVMCLENAALHQTHPVCSGTSVKQEDCRYNAGHLGQSSSGIS